MRIFRTIGRVITAPVRVPAIVVNDIRRPLAGITKDVFDGAKAGIEAIPTTGPWAGAAAAGAAAAVVTAVITFVVPGSVKWLDCIEAALSLVLLIAGIAGYVIHWRRPSE